MIWPPTERTISWGYGQTHAAPFFVEAGETGKHRLALCGGDAGSVIDDLQANHAIRVGRSQPDGTKRMAGRIFQHCTKCLGQIALINRDPQAVWQVHRPCNAPPVVRGFAQDGEDTVRCAAQITAGRAAVGLPAGAGQFPVSRSGASRPRPARFPLPP